jgi:hypothetical protein
MAFITGFLKRLEAKSFLGEVVRDYGVISEEKIGIAFSKTSILLVKRHDNLQIVIRKSSFAYLATGVRYEYIPASSASRLKEIIEDVNAQCKEAEQPALAARTKQRSQSMKKDTDT